jgi:uncharacterized protein
LSFAAALRYVEQRAEDLAQPRPERGNATNAVCIVGRRELSRGLFLDRRAFLASYDPIPDDADQTILTRTLKTVVPICVGVNLEYYFSCVDPAGWGAGTQSPHNVTALLGVMDGAASDLRTGLPSQLVETHEPMRLVMLIETSSAAMLRVLEREPALGQLARNRWTDLAVVDPDSREISYYRDHQFQVHRPRMTQLSRAATSLDWYRGRTEALEFAEIGK